MDVRSLSTSLPAEQAERGTELSITQDHQRSAALPQRSGTATGPATAALKTPKHAQLSPLSVYLFIYTHAHQQHVYKKLFALSKFSRKRVFFQKISQYKLAHQKANHNILHLCKIPISPDFFLVLFK